MRTEVITYVLGAGFSAGLGIPVMSRFMESARDLYEEDGKSYAHFYPVFERMRQMRAASDRVAIDLFNVEDVLSVAEMESTLALGDGVGDVRKFITDTIRARTPSIPDEIHRNERPTQAWFPEPWRWYAAFVFSLARIRFEQSQNLRWTAVPACVPEVDYRVVTLNYDTVVESVLGRAAAMIGGTIDPLKLFALSKLHGSIADNSVIAPTWNKRLDGEIAAAWKRAAESLEAAHQIRFLGYSFPVTDVNVRFLLTSALQRNDRLKKIDVVCVDPEKTVEARYRALLRFSRIRFSDSPVQTLFTLCDQHAQTDSVRDVRVTPYLGLERAHSGIPWTSS